MIQVKELGVILHVMEKEAVVKGDNNAPRKGTPVFVDGVRIGRTGLPFGKVESPFIPIILETNFSTIVGKMAFLGKLEKKKNSGKKRKSQNKKMHSRKKQHKKRK